VGTARPQSDGLGNFVIKASTSDIAQRTFHI
jgi:hypothetical protein